MASSELLNCVINLVCTMLQNDIYSFLKKKENKPRKRVWVRKWVARRRQQGLCDNFLKEVRLEDPKTFKNHLRMSGAKFDELLSKVKNRISKQDTFMREAIPAHLKLQVVLRYLASGDSFSSLEASYRVPKSTISKFLVPVLESICDALEDNIKVPHNEGEWQKVANGFAARWNFPTCCGAIDGKHIRIRCPPFSNSDYYNYKGFFSTVLFAMVDSNYKFIYVNIGRNGRINDSTIFRDSCLRSAIEDNSINFPKWGIIVGDDAFPLSTYLLKPYSHHGSLADDEKIFNYRLSRARRVVENAFGILAARFRIFLRPIDLYPEKIDYIVRACCSLHNWLRQTDVQVYFPAGCVDHEDLEHGVVVPGQWRQEIANQTFQSVHATTSRNPSQQASQRRDSYKNYFVADGAVDWQWKFIK